MRVFGRFDRRPLIKEAPHPIPLPEYGARGQEPNTSSAIDGRRSERFPWTFQNCRSCRRPANLNPRRFLPKNPEPAPAFPPITYAVMPTSIGLAEAWISIALGVLLLFIFPNTISYLHSPTDFEQTQPRKPMRRKHDSVSAQRFFLEDLGVTVFAAALVLEGIALAAARKIAPLWVAFVVTVLAAIFNVIVIAHVDPLIGFPIFCGVGVVILGYMALTQWRLISVPQIILRQDKTGAKNASDAGRCARGSGEGKFASRP